MGEYLSTYVKTKDMKGHELSLELNKDKWCIGYLSFLYQEEDFKQEENKITCFTTIEKAIKIWNSYYPRLLQVDTNAARFLLNWISNKINIIETFPKDALIETDISILFSEENPFHESFMANNAKYLEKVISKEVIENPYANMDTFYENIEDVFRSIFSSRGINFLEVSLGYNHVIKEEYFSSQEVFRIYVSDSTSTLDIEEILIQICCDYPQFHINKCNSWSNGYIQGAFLEIPTGR